MMVMVAVVVVVVLGNGGSGVSIRKEFKNEFKRGSRVRVECVRTGWAEGEF